MTILVAEIGWNFLGDLSLAKKMILSAKKSGADAVKFQIWDPKFLTNGLWDYDGRRQIYEKAYLSGKKYRILKDFSIKNSIDCFASAFNIDGLKLLKKLNDKWVKIPSHESYNLPLINYAIKNFEKIIISAGCLKKFELKKLINLILINKALKKVTLLHCVSSYPLKAKNCNFEKFHYIKKMLGKVGYSGHFDDIDDAIYAISCGAEIVEKHFTTNNKLAGRDNKFSLTPDKFKNLNRYRNNYNDFIINKGLNLQKCELDIYKNYRGRWSKNINI